MDFSDVKPFIDLVRAEYERRESLLPWDENPDYARDQWMFTDLPFLHDLCLLYLVAVWHHMERQLLFCAACALGHGKEIKRSEFEARQRTLLKMPTRERWKEVDRSLQLQKCIRYNSIKTLQLLANSYKHSPRLQPDPKLVEHLKLDKTLIYAPIPESFLLKKGLARIVSLPEDEDFPAVTERFVEHAHEFLQDIKLKNFLSSVRWGRINLSEAAH